MHSEGDLINKLTAIICEQGALEKTSLGRFLQVPWDSCDTPKAVLTSLTHQ